MLDEDELELLVEEEELVLELEEVELEDEELPLDEDELELLDPGVIPPLLQPCNAIAPAATKIKAIFFIQTILSDTPSNLTYAACRAYDGSPLC